MTIEHTFQFEKNTEIMPKKVADVMKVNTEKAIIGFWRMNLKQEFKCYHYFYVPTPLKRETRRSDRKDWGKKNSSTVNV